MKSQVLILGGVNSNNLIYESYNLDKELTKIDPVRALTSGEITSDYLGRSVYLSNSIAPNQEWVIAGVNHDNTSGTVDLISRYTLLQNTTTYSSTGTSYYDDSTLRKYLNDTIYNSFADKIKTAMSQITTSYYRSNEWKTLQEHIKIPSLYELGFNDQNSTIRPYHQLEGNKYPIFDTGYDGAVETNYNIIKYIDVDNQFSAFYTRTMYIYTNDSRYPMMSNIYYVSPWRSACGENKVSETSLNALGIIRFSKK